MRPEPDELTSQLQRWGHAVVNRWACSRGERTVHVLHKTRDMAPGTQERALRQLVGRDGGERRRYMAQQIGIKGLKEVPMWAVDPVRGRNDAGLPHDNPEQAVDMGIPDDVRWVDRAVQEMDRVSPIRARCVREEFMGTGTQRMKAGRIATAYGGAFSVRQYRYELQLAKEWLRGRMPMRSAA